MIEKGIVKLKCPRCGSEDVEYRPSREPERVNCSCNRCGWEWLELEKGIYDLDEIIVRTLKEGSKILVAETADFNEYMYLYRNFVLFHGTDTYRYMVIKFKDEGDAEEFYNIIDRLASVFEDHWGTNGTPFFWRYQDEFIKTILSFYDDAKILADNYKPTSEVEEDE